MSRPHPRSNPESPGRVDQGPMTRPTQQQQQQSANRERASTTSEPRTHGRRPRRGLSDTGMYTSNSAQAAGSPRTPDRRDVQPAAGQTLQEFLNSLDQSSHGARPERPAHRHSTGPPSSESTLPVRAGRPVEGAFTRRRSSPLILQEANGANPSTTFMITDDALQPNSPPPRYQESESMSRRVQFEAGDAHPGNPVSVDHLISQFYLKPRWQPDVEVSECPICQRAFSFFYRKHHCRKCGRVVCASCSPHRITIPRQYIVEPPGEGSEGEQEESFRSDAFEDGYDENSIFGGQEVRLCNPCVPDPNPLPPPDYATTAQNVLTSFPPPSSDEPSQVPIPARRYPRRSGAQRDWIGNYEAGHAQTEGARQRSATDPHGGQGVTSPTGLRPHRRSIHGQIEQAANNADATGLHHAASHSSSHRYRHRSHYSTSVLPPQGNADRNAPLPQVPTPRPIAEEDECPICHDELPPKGTDGSEANREAHISRCIEEHLYPGARRFSVPTRLQSEDEVQASASSAPSSSRYLPPPSPPQFHAAPSMPAAAASSSSSSSATAARPRAETHSGALLRRANMLVYHASEKDCLDAEGKQKECIICLEEFVVGAELGRLECWCVFHRMCIREWWDTKGLGACPTHQDGI